MIRIRVLGILIFMMALSLCSFSKNDNYSDTLLIKARSNLKLMSDNPEKAFVEAFHIQKEAIKQNNHLAELIVLNSICLYYEKKYDFKNMIISAESLFNKAEQYHIFAYKTMAKNILFKAYSFNGLYSKSLEQLEQGLAIIEKEDANDSLVIEAKSNIYISFSNYYSIQNDNQNRLKYIKLSMLEHNRFKNIDYKKKLQYIDFANLATVFNELNTDSAEYYALKSMKSDNNYGLGEIEFSNLLVLGLINQKMGNHLMALSYFEKAEQIKNYKNHLNVEVLYNSFIDTYKAIGDSLNIEKYTSKLEHLKLQVSESQNQSLFKMMDDQVLNDKSKKYQYILLVSVVLVLGLLIFGFYFTRKRIILANFEKKSLVYLNKEFVKPNEEAYSKLIEMIKKNDLAFLTLFHEIYPDFSKKLQNINPKIVQTEIEFCALLKLNIPTKDIARYRNIEHRTVQNKKYLIRKKLDIPKNADIYYWFNNL
jgi:hypothetical protein